jgi:polyisoprenoid-binding protein YceI
MNVPSMTAPDLLALLASGALAGDWVLDPSKSSVRLATRSMWGLAPVRGAFREVSGRGTVSRDGSAGGASGASGTLTVAAASLDTGNGRRDTHLRSADFFDSDNHPDITFSADRIRASGPGVSVTGALTVLGRTRPLSFQAGASVPDDGEIWLDAKVRVNRADFGLTRYRLGAIALNSTITIHAVFTRP